MSLGWSIFIIVIVVINMAGAAWLLWWTSRRRGNEAETTGHVWDGDLSEYNKPLPKWWINLFWLTIVFGVAYLAWYPGMGHFAGAGGWSSRGQLEAEQAEAEKKLAASFQRFEGQPIDVIAKDGFALETGRRIYANNCAMCHGSDARGAKGYPNLTDSTWLWGSSADAVLASVLEGRQAAMPALGGVLGSEQAITEAAVYVQSLSGMAVDPALAGAGAKHFAGVCAACHGADGKGNQALGAPNLTDGDWLYGSAIDDIRATIRGGRNGQMPAHRAIIGETRSRLVAAYVYSLSNGAKPQP
jgi:cytochrome c oxidase cbb3-type subunit 3